MSFLTAVIALVALYGVAAQDTPCKADSPHIITTFFNSIGDIYSPGYSKGTYPNDIQCIYSIRAPFGTRILLSFQDMDIDPFDLCQKDKVIVHEGPLPTGPAHGVFCGTERPNSIVSQGNALTIVFQSDFLTGRKGFHIRYQVGLNHILCPGQGACRNGKCFSIFSRCNGIDDCGDGTDEQECHHPLPTIPCGTTPIPPLGPQGLDRIVGGQEAKLGSWPWQADLQLDVFKPNGHMCGGTLINAEWVVSAAHCFQGNGRALEWRIHLGNHHKFKKDANEQIRYAKRIIVYPGYTGDDELIYGRVDFANDIALIKLNAPVQFTNYVRPACLPQQNQEVKTGEVCMATGWGMTRGTGNNEVLKQVPLDIQPSENCNNDMIPHLKKSMICVKHGKGFNDVCHGDSGGPLVCKYNNSYYVMGATSHGTVTTYMAGACALPGAHTVYAKIADKINWISEKMDTYDD